MYNMTKNKIFDPWQSVALKDIKQGLQVLSWTDQNSTTTVKGQDTRVQAIFQKLMHNYNAYKTKQNKK